MSGVLGQMGLSATVELKGHLIDSLTLSKVIDRVQNLGGDYHLNDIRVGSQKKDITNVNMTLYAANQQVMEKLLETIAPYGAVAQPDRDESHAVTCQQDAQLPEAAFEIRMPSRVFAQGKWQALENGGSWALVHEQGTFRMKPISELRQGDVLVSGTHGLQW